MVEADPGAAKAALRAELRAKRRALGPEQRQREMAQILALLRPMLEGRPLVAYSAVGSECDPMAVMHERWSGGEALWLPRVVGRDLAWHRVAGIADLRSGYRGIPEPDPARCPIAEPPADSLVLVPGLGFTAGGQRLGQGGGFYDRALPRLRAGGALLVGLGFACQIRPHLPVEAHDLVLDAVCAPGVGIDETP